MDLDKTFADIVTGRPHPFTIGRKHLALHPVTLAKSLLLSRHVEELGVNWSLLAANTFLEALRLVRSRRDVVAAMLAIHATPNTRRDLFDETKMAERRNLFASASDEDLATLLVLALSEDKTEEVMRHTGMDKERSRLARVAKVRKGGSILTFGGVTFLGTFVGQLMEMGYSDEEILYERGYSYLKLMIADKVTTIYLTEEERRQLPPDIGNCLVNAEAPDAVEKLNEYLASRGMNPVAST